MKNTPVYLMILGSFLPMILSGCGKDRLNNESPKALDPGFELPKTISVLVTGKQISDDCITDTFPIQKLDFEEYVRAVLPNEWIAGWEKDALKAGAIAVKTYAWYWIINQKYPGRGYDVRDSICDQVYIPDSSRIQTDAAIEDTWNWMMIQGGQVFEAQYDSGTPGAPDPLLLGRLSQWGTQYWAKREKDWQWILHHYYDPIEIK